jgi:hypothetical protein
MTIDISLVEPMMFNNNGKFIVPSRIVDKIDGKYLLVYYLEKLGKIEIIGVNEPVVDVTLYLSEGKLSRAVDLLNDLFGKPEISNFEIKWTSGICDVNTKDFSGCIWHGFVAVPGSFSMTRKEIKEFIMKWNVKYGEKIVDGVTVENIELVEVN